MCYNKTYAPKFPTVGQAVVSTMGHDTKRVYLVVAVLSPEFVLCVDGRVRPLEKPKTKRVKHVKPLCEADEKIAQKIASGKLTDTEIKKVLEQFI